jgi:hypothetical protein
MADIPHVMLRFERFRRDRKPALGSKSVTDSWAAQGQQMESIRRQFTLLRDDAECQKYSEKADG